MQETEIQLAEFGDQLLGPLREQRPDPPPDLSERAMGRVHASITAGEVLELCTSVLTFQFFCPLLDSAIGLLEPRENRKR